MLKYMWQTEGYRAYCGLPIEMKYILGFVKQFKRYGRKTFFLGPGGGGWWCGVENISDYLQNLQINIKIFTISTINIVENLNIIGCLEKKITYVRNGSKFITMKNNYIL